MTPVSASRSVWQFPATWSRSSMMTIFASSRSASSRAMTAPENPAPTTRMRDALMPEDRCNSCALSKALLLAVRVVGEREPGGAGEEGEADHVVPAHGLGQHKFGENDEDQQRDDFLEDLELVAIQDLEPDPIRGDLKAVLKKSDAPGDEDDDPKRAVVEIFEMTIPSEGHEGVGGD